MGTPITAYLLILAIIAVFTNADTIDSNSALAAFGLRVKIDGKKTIAPHIFYQSTDRTVREVYWHTSKTWRQGSFESESRFKPRSNTPLAVASLPADDDAKVVRTAKAEGPSQKQGLTLTVGSGGSHVHRRQQPPPNEGMDK
jgi:hypothetical protein